MDLTLANIEIPPNWGLIESEPNRLIYKSPFIVDPYSSIHIINEDGKIYGLVKNNENQEGTKVLLGRGLPIEISLMLMVDLFSKSIFEFDDFEN
ncbi:hypothetical protein [Aquirufa nivalisilvae]